MPKRLAGRSPIKTDLYCRTTGLVSSRKKVNKQSTPRRLSGQKRIRIHFFRHSNVSVLANGGINIREIARRLGHAKVELTWNTYSHLYPREQEKAVDILNKIA